MKSESAKKPSWLIWVLAFLTASIAATLINFIYVTVIGWLWPDKLETVKWYELVRTLWVGGIFVVTAALIQSRHRVLAGVIALSAILVFFGYGPVVEGLKPIDASIRVSTGGGITGRGDGTSAELSKRMNKGESVDIEGLHMELVGYGNSSVTVHLSGNNSNSLYVNYYEDKTVNIPYNQSYSYSTDPDCCDQISYRYELTFKR